MLKYSWFYPKDLEHFLYQKFTMVNFVAKGYLFFISPVRVNADGADFLCRLAPGKSTADYRITHVNEIWTNVIHTLGIFQVAIDLWCRFFFFFNCSMSISAAKCDSTGRRNLQANPTVKENLDKSLNKKNTICTLANPWAAVAILCFPAGLCTLALQQWNAVATRHCWWPEVQRAQK